MGYIPGDKVLDIEGEDVILTVIAQHAAGEVSATPVTFVESPTGGRRLVNTDQLRPVRRLSEIQARTAVVIDGTLLADLVADNGDGTVTVELGGGYGEHVLPKEIVKPLA